MLLLIHKWESTLGNSVLTGVNLQTSAGVAKCAREGDFSAFQSFCIHDSHKTRRLSLANYNITYNNMMGQANLSMT